MPRIHPRTIWQARAIDLLLPRLLPVCRDLRSAQLELRWLREHAARNHTSEDTIYKTFNGFVQRRSKGEPLQYILGTEYFGDLEIVCRPGVLIPRQETAASVSYLVDLLCRGGLRKIAQLRLLDLCTGTGCIPLLFHRDFYSSPRNKHISLDAVGIDVSKHALALARRNQMKQLQGTSRGGTEESFPSLERIIFVQADVLRTSNTMHGTVPTVSNALKATTNCPPKFDILISNPPYISSHDYLRTTSRSVRDYEPKLALVPPPLDTITINDGDSFYPRLLDIAEQVDAKVVLFEVADFAQAKRVAALAVKQGQWAGGEIWRDQPGDDSTSNGTISVMNGTVQIRGSGNGRSVLLYRGEGKAWLGI